MLHRLFLIAVVAFRIASQPVAADDSGIASPLTVRGFATVGLVRANDETLVYTREITQPVLGIAGNPWRRDSRLGLQLNYSVSPHWELVAQLVARERATNTLPKSLEWAFVKFKPDPDWDIRTGRVGIDAFLLSDHRNVGYSYTWARPPSEYYSWFAPSSLDGIDIVKRWEAGEAQIRIKAFSGKTSTKLPLWSGSTPFNLSPITGISAEYESGFWRLRGNLSQGRVTSPYIVPAQLMDALNQAAPLWPGSSVLLREFATNGARMTYASVGLGYDGGDWQLLSEISHTGTDRLVIPRGERAYISLGRHFGAWLPYVLLSKSRDRRHASTSDPLTPLLNPLRDVALGAINRQLVNQSGLAVGFRWDWTSNAALKLQYDRAKVPADGLLLWYMKPGKDWTGGYRELWSLSLDFVF